MYIKKIIVMNEVTPGFGRGPIKALVALQKNGRSVACAFTAFNLEMKGRRGAFMFGVRSPALKLQKFPLTGAAQNFQLDPETDLSGYLDCTLVYDEGGVLAPVLWGATSGGSMLIGNMADGFSAPPVIARSRGDEAIQNTKNKDNSSQFDKEADNAKTKEAKIKGIVPTDTKQDEYCDYAVATESYYPPEFDQFAYYGSNAQCTMHNAQSKDKIATDKVSLRDEQSKSGTSARPVPQSQPLKKEATGNRYQVSSKGQSAINNEQLTISDKDAEEKHSPAKEKEAENEKKGAKPPKTPPVYTGGQFYKLVKSQIDELFGRYPRDEFLNGLIDNSDFVRVSYDDSGQYYVVGLLYEGADIKYICYGVPGQYAADPPKELEGFCQWLPFDAQKPYGGGYWMMYQDAESGKSVTADVV